ncbi:MAG: 7-cyano-7-deazaguanine synthase QueC [Bdellovibrio sp.]|nr:MAG: 7-cyano-7-deazaguanine synthase QueC [Bdellovibrio sp.]
MNMGQKAVVLLSSGLDSTVNLYRACQDLDVVLALTFDYGQKAASQEIAYSRKHCEKLGVSHKVVELPWLSQISQSALVSSFSEVPLGDQVKVDDYNTSLNTAQKVWVSNRNGVFLNIAAAFAEGLKADYVIPGFNKEEAQTFPDNSDEFLRIMEKSFSFSTQNKVQTKCFTIHMDKRAIAQMGRELNVPFEWIWPCYLGGARPCGACESCQR